MSGLIVKGGKNLMLARTLIAPITFAIGTGTTAPVESNTSLETMIVAWYGGGNYKPVLAGYPTFDTTNKRATVRCYVASTEANGNNISETGLFNTDGTPVMLDRHTFTAVTKNAQTEIIFETIFEMV